ncbi:dicarboxylate/amino acid:cation symporter [Puniceicoccaceae bacterium K14]|nr:dicarboxylate/amino acid:cation symporter [Puniceicoccaceae bacterium K14]
MDLSKIKLTKYILIGMGFGVVLGLVLYWTELNKNDFVDTYVLGGVLKFFGDIFVRSLKLLVTPLVLVSLVCGTAAIDDVRKLGSTGLKTLGLYLLTTSIAITLGLVVASFFNIGKGFEITIETDYVVKEAPAFIDVLINIFPTNPFKALVEENMLQIIVFAVLLGIALLLAGERGKRVLKVFEDLNEVIMQLVMLLMLIAPIGVFAKVCIVFATTGFDAIVELGAYFLVVLSVLIVHALIVYPTLLKTLAGLSPLQFLRKFWQTQVFAFSTASSNATIPVTLTSVEEKLGVSNKIGSFTVPLGATVNMDGTSIMQGVATVFIANVAGVDLSLGQFVMVVVSATLASVGTAGVPGVGMIMLGMVLKQVGLPTEYIALIVGIDRLLDMVRTAVNVTGDAAVTCVVAKSEGELDTKVFKSNN